jgi:hypothetical protein
MEILSLTLALTDEDLNNLIAKHAGTDPPVRDLKVRLTPQGARVSGAYPVAFFNVRFETLWALSVRGRELAAHLAELKVAGAPAGMVRGTLLEMLGANLEEKEGTRVEGETVLVDPDMMLRRVGLVGKTNLKAIRCEDGRVIMEAGAPAASSPASGGRQPPGADKPPGG